MLQKQRARFGYLLVLPALLLVTLLNVVPLIQALILSVQSQNLIRPNPTAFVGARHYLRALTSDPEFWSSTIHTFQWTIGSVVIAYIISLGLALLLNMEIRGRAFLRAMFLIPWVVPNVVTALLWKWFYNGQFGVANFVLMKLGIISEPIQWLSTPEAAMPSVIAVQVWKLYPLMTVVLLAALQNVPKEVLEASRVDGANPIQRFFYVTFNFIRPQSMIIVLISAIWTFQSFDIVYLLTGGGPGGATQTLAIMVYTKAFWATQLGYASAIGVLMMVLLVSLGLAQQALEVFFLKRAGKNG
ncbi:sugar ABC transporter permease [Devosia sp. 2618]|uniref:carbohydrate ABC transporter permease n=1 Tax=Devosia sp. 2618 TaxID=3156454 RepID=UPI00339B6475